MPLYQRGADKAIEREIAEQLAQAWKCEAVEFPATCAIDWYLKRGTALVCLVEIKDRKNRARGDFPTVLLNAMKVMSLHFGALAFSARSVFVVRFTDGVYWIDVAQIVGCPTTVRGRTDRGDPNDIEPCVEIPIARLRLLTAQEGK